MEDTKRAVGWTAGPWRVEYNGEILGPRCGSSSPIIATMPVWWAKLRGQGHASQELQEANARLIAAAPELYAACEKILSDPYTTCCCAEIVRAALAKAKGE